MNIYEIQRRIAGEIQDAGCTRLAGIGMLRLSGHGEIRTAGQFLRRLTGNMNDECAGQDQSTQIVIVEMQGQFPTAIVAAEILKWTFRAVSPQIGSHRVRSLRLLPLNIGGREKHYGAGRRDALYSQSKNEGNDILQHQTRSLFTLNKKRIL